MRLKNALQKVHFLVAKSIQKRYTLNCRHKCPCTFPHSYGKGRQNQIKQIADLKSTLKTNMRSSWTVFQILLLSAVIFIQKVLHGNEIKQYLKN